MDSEKKKLILSINPDLLPQINEQEIEGIHLTLKDHEAIHIELDSKINNISLIKGDKGTDGYTPQKNVDYFDGEPGYTPIKNVDYFDGERGAPGRNGIDGENGIGIPGKDGSPDTPQQIVEKINTTTDSIEPTVIKGGVTKLEDVLKELKDPKSPFRLKPKDIEGMPLDFSDQRWHGGGKSIELQTNGVDNGSQTLLNLTAGSNITLTDNGAGRVTIASSGGGGSVTDVTATSPITSSGGTTPNISTSMSTNKLIGRGTAGTGVMQEITLGTNLSLSGTTLNATAGTGTVTSVTLATPNSTLSLGGTNPITTSGTINADINLSHANTWAALQTFSTSTISITGGSNGYVLSTNGSGTLSWIAAGGGITGSGASGQVTYWSGTSSITGDNNIFWNSTTQEFGIQTSASPQAVGHFVSALGQTAGTVSGLSSGTLTESLNTPVSDSVTAGAPLTVGSYSGLASFNYFTGSYIATGNSYQYNIYNIYFDGSTYFYSPVQANCNAGTDDGSSNNFSISISWSATPTGGGYVGTVIARVTNFGGTQYFDATGQSGVGSSGSIVDDGSGSPYNWGSSSFPSGYTQSPDFIPNGTTYSYDVWSQQTSPSGHLIYVMGDSPSFSDGVIGGVYPFSLSLHNANGFTVKFHETSPNSSFYKIISASNSATQYTNTTPDSSTLSPNSYGYAPDGTGTTPNYYRATAYKTISGVLVFGTSPSWSVNYDSAFNTWYSSVSWSSLGAAADGYMVEYSTDGITASKHFDNMNVVSFFDDTLTAWISGAATLTPTLFIPPAGLFVRDSQDNRPTLILRTPQTTGQQENWLDFQDGNGASQGHIETTQSIFSIFSPHEMTYDGADHIWLIGSSPFLYLSSSGRLGVNQSSPTEALDVSGSANFSGNAYVRGAPYFSYKAITSTYAAGSAECVLDCTSGTFTVTLQTAVGIKGLIMVIKNSGTGVVTVATSAGQLIDSSSTYTITSGAWVWVMSTNSGWIIIG